MASQPGTTTEIEAADDFLLNSPARITGASFVGLFAGGTGTPSISEVAVEFYRVFPLDSDTTRTPNVPTRTNSPSDVAFAGLDSAGSELTFSSSVLATSFVALNSVRAGGIHPKPNQTTGGDGAVSGKEVQIDVSFTTPVNLPQDHYFFIPQVTLTNGASFLWLSGSRPIAGTGTTPFSPDLQAWIRDANLDPDWLRVGTDIVGGSPAPTFNGAFSIEGTATPEPFSAAMLLGGLGLLALRKSAVR